MRSRLRQLMKQAGYTGHSLYEVSGVPAATTYRYLKGDIADPHSETVQKWARALKVSEAQLLGYDPIEGMPDERPEPPSSTLESVLTRDELFAIEGMRQLDKETRRSWLRLTIILCKNSEKPCVKGGDKRIIPDRRGGGKRCLAIGSSGPKYKTDQTDNNGGRPGESKTA